MKEQAYEEARLLAIHATKKEKKRLVAVTVIPSHYAKCIYGRMTGDCFSERAHELISECAKAPFYASIEYTTTRNMTNVLDSDLRYFTAIEVVIYRNPELIPELVKIIKA